MLSFGQYRAIVEFLVNQQRKPLDQAIAEAGVPLHLADQLRHSMADPIQIVGPDLIIQPQTIALCVPFSETDRQPTFTAYSEFVLDERRWSRDVIGSLHQTSNDLLGRLPNPTTMTPFQSRGLVVGYIQSGKTANMAALIARAADAGYRLFILLAGTLNDLRAQTQRRLDQEITGQSEDDDDGPFIQHEPGMPAWIRLANAGLRGDFRPGTHNDLNPLTPKLAVIKKNTAVLRRFTAWLRRSPVPLDQLPAIVIDDEADQASIDTHYGRVDAAGDDLDPSATNNEIRELLRTLPKCVYIGFTATPFANVLIDAGEEEDLYPRDFIAALPEPPGYFGPRQLFGIGMAPSALSTREPEPPPMDVIRYIPHDDLDLLDHLTSDADCPPALSDAILAFILSSSARLARGHDRHHFTMLVHPSQRTDDHEIFASVIRSELDHLFRRAVQLPRSFPAVVERAKRMWEEDFARVTTAAQAADGIPDFDTVWRFARAVTDHIEIKTLNMRSPDELDYHDPPKRYIVVGGNKLSRGLTLEGLSVSVFTRNANTYDTLLQMGRWFGFRPGYHDLTRIFVEERLADQFADLARVELELRHDIQKYSREPDPVTPRELMPLIRAHPTMAVTSPLKMGAGRTVRISFQGTTQNTVVFPISNLQTLRANMEVGKTFVRSLDHSLWTEERGTHLWTGVQPERVLAFLDSYVFGKAPAVNGAMIPGYIRRQVARGELTHWDVLVPSGNATRDLFSWSDRIFSHRILRAPYTARSIKVLSDPGDIDAWRHRTNSEEADPTQGALFLYLVDRQSSGKRGSFFPDGGGEDILGLVFIFPRSRSLETVDYISQQNQ